MFEQTRAKEHALNLARDLRLSIAPGEFIPHSWIGPQENCVPFKWALPIKGYFSAKRDCDFHLKPCMFLTRPEHGAPSGGALNLGVDWRALRGRGELCAGRGAQRQPHHRQQHHLFHLTEKRPPQRPKRGVAPCPPSPQPWGDPGAPPQGAASSQRPASPAAVSPAPWGGAASPCPRPLAACPAPPLPAAAVPVPCAPLTARAGRARLGA